MMDEANSVLFLLDLLEGLQHKRNQNIGFVLYEDHGEPDAVPTPRRY